MKEKTNVTKKIVNVSIPLELWVPLRVEAAKQDQSASRFVTEFVLSELQRRLLSTREAEAEA